MKTIVAIFVGLISANSAFAAGISEMANTEVRAPTKLWGIEATFQAQGLAGDSSPLFGPTASYKLMDRNEVGVRALAPVSGSVDQGSYEFQGLWRYYAVEARANLFFEGSGGFNSVRGFGFGSVGAALGVRYDLATDLAFGGSGGFELANATVQSGWATASSSTYIYPKTSIFVSMFF